MRKKCRDGHEGKLPRYELTIWIMKTKKDSKNKRQRGAKTILGKKENPNCQMHLGTFKKTAHQTKEITDQ